MKNSQKMVFSFEECVNAVISEAQSNGAARFPQRPEATWDFDAKTVTLEFEYDTKQLKKQHEDAQEVMESNDFVRSLMESVTGGHAN